MAVDSPSPSLTVTKNVNGSAAVSEEHRVQASQYLASYIKVPNIPYFCRFATHFYRLVLPCFHLSTMGIVGPTPRVNA